MTRRYRFPAAHVLANASFSRERNLRLYGKCANAAGHGHDYEVEVSVTGPIDPETGRIVAPALLDAIFAEAVTARYAHRMLNDEEPFSGVVASGAAAGASGPARGAGLVPTAENIALAIRDLLGDAIARRSTARLAHLRVVETPRNAAEVGELG